MFKLRSMNFGEIIYKIQIEISSPNPVIFSFQLIS